MAGLFEDLIPAGQQQPPAGGMFDDIPVEPGFKPGDLLKGLKRGVQQVPGSLTGLADIPGALLLGDRYADKAAEIIGDATGFKPGRWAKEAELSPGAQAAQQELDTAWKKSGADRLGTALLTNHADLPAAWDQANLTEAGKAIIQNPGASLMNVIESVPSMLVGGAIGKGLNVAAKVAPVFAGAAGEGLITAGQQMDQTDQSVDPRTAAATSLAAGAGTAMIAGVGGKVAQKLGLEDIQTAMAGGRAEAAGRGAVARIGGGAASEAGQEALQSGQEQAWQNFAEDKPLGQGMIRGAVEGAIAGAVMGGGANLLPSRPPQPVTVLRQDGQGEVVIDPQAGPISAAAADHVARTQTTEDLFGYLTPTAPVTSALGPLAGASETGDMFADLLPAEQAAPSGPLQEFASQVEAVDLPEAQRLVKQSRDAGSDHLAIIEHPAGGGFIAAPREWLNADQLQATRALQPSSARQAGTAPMGWEGFQSGDRVTTKAGTTGTLHFDDTRMIAYVTPDKLDGGIINPDAGKTTAKAQGSFSVVPAEVGKSVDHAASKANATPSEAQIAAGNYQKGHIKVGSLDIAIENPVGSTRTGPGWQTTMQDHYGYMKRTEGADGDQVDVYVKAGTPTNHTGPVFVIDQYDPVTGKFDEHKAMVGYRFQGAAIKAYDGHFSDRSGPARRRGVIAMPAEAFKDWAKNGDTSKPAIFTTAPSSNATIQNDRNDNDQIRYAQSDETADQGSSTEQGRYRDVPENGAGVGVDPRPGQVPLARYGKARQGAVSVVGVHYSGAERQELSSAYYGTGIKGAEAVRLQSLPVELRHRTYFYVNEGQGVFPESGVGSHAHEVELVNLYDARQDSLGLAKSNRGDFNAFEVAVVAAGFDGYYVPEGFGRQGVAALLGQHAVAVTHKGTGYRGQVAQRPQHATAETDADRIAKNRTLPMGQMSGADWKRMVQGVDLSHLDDQKMYFKDQIARRFNQPGRTKKATSLDREVFGLAAVGSSSTRILSSIAEASDDPYRRELAKLLQAKGIAPAVTVSDGDGQHAAAYDPRSNVVALFTEADAERHFLHEATHAATLTALNNKGLAAGQMKALYKHVVAQLGADTHYGLSRLDEFVAEAFTNGRFQAELRRLPAAPGSSLASSWHWFVRTVRQLLGLDAKHESALSQALQLGLLMMDEVSNRTAVDRSTDGAELKALRRAAARLERPEDGITFRITDDGMAIATGPKSKIVPPRFAKFARENGLKYEVRRLPVASGTEAPAMPEAYRESGAKYFGEMASDARPIDRTGKTRFNVQRLAPNGQPSNLNEKQWHQVRTPAFKDWFGDWQIEPAKSSKVVDENGEPLVVYHGTTKGGVFSEFKPNDRGLIWAASQRATAVSYAGFDRDVDLGKQERQRGVMPVFLNIRNASESNAGGKDYVDLPQFDGEDFTDWFAQMAKKAGRDGAVIRNVIDDGGEGASEIKTAGDNYVVFDAAQVKSATQNAGTFDSSNPDVRFSVADPDKLIGQVANQLHDLFSSTGSFNWLHKSIGTQYHKAQIDQHFKKVFDLGQKYLLDTSRFAMDAAEKAPSLLHKLESLRDIFTAKAAKRADVGAIADPIFAGTLEGAVWNADTLRKRFGLTDTQIDLYREFRAGVDKSLDDLGVSELAQVTKAQLPEIDLEQVKGADLDDARDRLHAALMHEAKLVRADAKQASTAEAEALEAKAKSLEGTATDVLQKAKRIAELKAAGYAPMMRFGRYAVDVTSATGEREFFGMYESRREANQAARALQAAYPEATVTQGQMDTESWRLFAGLDPSSLEVFAEALGADQKAVYQDFLRLTVNNRSAMKRLLKQKGTPGYSRDMQRNLAQFVTSNGRLAAKNYHFGDLKKAVMDIPKIKGDVRNEAAKLVQYLQDPQEEAAGLRGYLFVHFLGGSVASALVNMTQPIVQTAPYLAQFGNSASALAKAGRLLASGKYDLQLTRAMQLAEREGLTAPHELHQLYAESMQTLGRNMMVRRGLHAWGSFFSLAESFNRKLTFIAAFNMARENGEANPFAFAQKAVEETQGIYNRGNRPDWARGAIGATVFTFKQFSIAYVEFLRRLYKADKKAFAIAMAILFVGAGADGWPFAEDIEDLLDTIGQFAGFTTNSKQWLRENTTKVFGELGGEFFRKGISAALPIDLSSRLGVQNLVPGSSMFKVSEADKTRDVLEFVGPFGGFVQAALRGFDAARTGNLAGAVTMAAPTALQNAAKAADMQAFGFYRDMKGRRVVDTDGYDAFMKGIGFQPNVVARESSKVRELQQNISQQRAIEKEIADKWAHGVFERNQATVLEAVEQLKTWNARNPEASIRITPRQIGERVKAMALSREQRFMKSAPPEMKAQVLEALQ